MDFERLLQRQGGAVSLAQAVECGMSAGTVRRRVREGGWERLHPQVYLVGGHRRTDEVRIRAASLWAGPSAVVCGHAAAYWHGMINRAPTLVDVTVPGAAKPKPQPGIRIRRRDLHPDDITGWAGIRVATTPFAALETAAQIPDGSEFLDRALQQHISFAAVYRSYCRNLGRPGSAAAGRLLIAAADRAASAAERLLVRLLREAGIDGWVLGHPVGPYTIDLAFLTQRVAIEVDSWAHHVISDRFENDRSKGNYLTLRGWVLLRFTWHRLNSDPDGCLHEIAETLTGPL